MFGSTVFLRKVIGSKGSIESNTFLETNHQKFLSISDLDDLNTLRPMLLKFLVVVNFSRFN